MSRHAVERYGQRVELRLIDRGRVGRRASITVLGEDGSGAAFTRPQGGRKDPYFQLPLDYWKKEWDRRLPLVGKAALLIALSQGEWFRLPAEKARNWYGISADTWERGLGELRDAKIIDRKMEWQSAPLTAAGHIRVYKHRLKPPFAHKRSEKEVRLKAVS